MVFINYGVMKKSILLTTVLLAFPCQAALLVYEGFIGYDPEKNFLEMGPNEHTIGLANAAAYGSSTSNIPDDMRPGDGLTFGALQVSGGAMHYSGGAANIASASITSTTSSPTIWLSYLVQLSTVSTGTGSGHEVRLFQGAASYFRVAGDSRGSGATFERPSVSYTGSGSQVAPTALVPSASETQNTYMILASLDSSSTGTGARLWVLDSTSFANFVDGGRQESFLNDPLNVYGSATAAYGGGGRGWNTEAAPALMEIIIQNGTNQWTIMDEIRYGETLHDVTPLIPEPTSAGLAAIGVLGLLMKRRC